MTIQLRTTSRFLCRGDTEKPTVDVDSPMENGSPAVEGKLPLWRQIPAESGPAAGTGTTALLNIFFL